MEQKILIIEMDSFKNNLIALINNAATESQIPYGVIELIVKDVYNSVKSTAQQEFEYAQQKVAEMNAKQQEVEQ